MQERARLDVEPAIGQFAVVMSSGGKHPRIATRALAVVVSAGAYAAAFPPWNLPWLAFVGMVPFLWALRGATGRSAVLLGFLWGTLCISFFGYWVPIGLATYYQQPGWFGFFFALAVAMVFKGSYFAAFGWLYGRFAAADSAAARIAFTAALYVTCELARAWLLTGHPWLLLGYAAVPYTPWVQMADLGGVYLLSFGIAAFNAAALELVCGGRGDRRQAAAIALLIALLPLGYGSVRMATLQDGGEASRVGRVGIVQADVDLGTVWKEEYYGAGLRAYAKLTQSLAESSPDLVVWPENALMFFLADEPLYLSSVVEVIRRLDTELVTGGPYHEEAPDGSSRYYNSAFHVTERGIGGRYDKVHLLPFAEYFPLSTIRFLQRSFGRVRTFAPAEEQVVLDTAIGTVGAMICFEAVYPGLARGQVARGADVLFNLSNDAWLLSHAGAEQHLQMVRLRAVENRRWVVRSTTTGVSAFIDPAGRLHGRLESGEAGTLFADITRSDSRTLYGVVGDWFALLCAAVVLASAGRLRRGSGHHA